MIHLGGARCSGDPEIADVAVAAIWGLVKGSPRLLRPDNSELGMPATALVPPLLDILKRSRVRNSYGLADNKNKHTWVVGECASGI